MLIYDKSSKTHTANVFTGGDLFGSYKIERDICTQAPGRVWTTANLNLEQLTFNLLKPSGNFTYHQVSY
jgi:hypothetical protein